MAVDWILSSKQRSLGLQPTAAGSSGPLGGCRHRIALPGSRTASLSCCQKIPRRTCWLHKACKLSTGQPRCSWEACPPPHQQPACEAFWLGGSRDHPIIPPHERYLAPSGTSQFGIVKLRFHWFIPKAVKAKCALGPRPSPVPGAMTARALRAMKRIIRPFSFQTGSATCSLQTSGATQALGANLWCAAIHSRKRVAPEFAVFVFLR